jgi:protein-S-isoprenylcysteine O-methyltransferase Ste14
LNNPAFWRTVTGQLLGKYMLHRLLRQWESPPTWLLLFILLAWLQARFVPLVAVVPATRHLGAVLIIGGLVVIVLAALQFRKHATTILPREVPRAMIDTGLYGYSRNPIYVADAMILAGVALRADLAGLVLVPVFMWVITQRFILGEEAGLRAQFGAGFEAYAARVKRWV